MSGPTILFDRPAGTPHPLLHQISLWGRHNICGALSPSSLRLLANHITRAQRIAPRPSLRTSSRRHNVPVRRLNRWHHLPIVRSQPTRFPITLYGRFNAYVRLHRTEWIAEARTWRIVEADLHCCPFQAVSILRILAERHAAVHSAFRRSPRRRAQCSASARHPLGVVAAIPLLIL